MKMELCRYGGGTMFCFRLLSRRLISRTDISKTLMCQKRTSYVNVRRALLKSFIRIRGDRPFVLKNQMLLSRMKSTELFPESLQTFWSLNRESSKDDWKLKINWSDMFDLGAKYTRGDKMKDKIFFKDVAGLHEAKQEILEFVDYLKSPAKFEELGAKPPNGALLTGPPGCGKTLLAKALACECGVPFFSMGGSDFVNMVGGVGASSVRSLFKRAKAEEKSVIFIDEIDVIGRKRSGNTNFGGDADSDQTLNQLLAEMDGMNSREGVIVIAATNREHVLDKALLRRFSRLILIDRPTLLEREELFQLYLGKLTLGINPDVYAPKLAQLTPGMTGADIANVCNEAAIHAARNQYTVVLYKNLEYAIERVISGAQKSNSTVSPGEKKVIAYHEAGHAVMGWLLEHTDALLKISIIPRTTGQGFSRFVPSELKIISSDDLFDKMCMALGGRVAENIVFNHISTSGEDDLKQVTKIAYAQVNTYGMSETIGPLSFPSEDRQNVFGGKPYSKNLQRQIEQEARHLLTNCYKHTEKVLQNNRAKLDIIAKALMEREALNYKDVADLIGPPKFEKKYTTDFPTTFDQITNINEVEIETAKTNVEGEDKTSANPENNKI